MPVPNSSRFHTLKKHHQKIDEMFKTLPYCNGDPFGMDKDSLKKALNIAAFLYNFYFRCKTTGVDNIPKGPVILAANHGGQIPFDATMITTAMLLTSYPPRIPRSMMDRFVPTLPVISNLYNKLGVVLGSPENASLLLKRKEILLTFPEGLKAIQKTIADAYKLQKFGHGFIRLALAHRAPVVPVSIVGPEEQYPTLYTIKRGAHLINVPSLPIWLQMPIPLLGLLPLPVKYYIHFDKPLYFKGDPDDDDNVIDEMSNKVKNKIDQNIVKLRTLREGIF